MDKLLVVDGSNLLFQMFYGMPARIVGKHGRSIHGTVGFVGALLKMIKILRPTHAVVLFDGECRNGRCDLNADYKANRPDYSQMPEEETPFCQLPDIFAALDHLKIAYAETTDCETDDWVAAYARAYGREMQVVISSFDSDFFQLITDTVSVFRYRGDNSQIWDTDAFCEKFGILPSQYADYKSLTGDTADNIVGARGIGPKTAAALMREYGSLESLLQKADEIKKPSARAALIADRERLLINQKLITLDGSAVVPFAVESLAWRYSGQTTGGVLSAIGAR